ncbi:MAG: DUF2690 domain-containing protein [Anaerolineales bacterium]|nr:DUF2690 domain-containing protein [Anaerolineales bacterium]
MRQNRLINLVFAIFLAIGFLAPWNPKAALAAVQCYGEGTATLPSCTGKFAGYQGCTSTNASDPNYIVSGGSKIEKRQSNNCNAKWTRVTNVSGQSGYIAASTKYGCSNYCYNQSIQSGGSVVNGAQVYTPMKGLTGTPTLHCGSFSLSMMSLPVGGPAPNYAGCKYG